MPTNTTSARRSSEKKGISRRKTRRRRTARLFRWLILIAAAVIAAVAVIRFAPGWRTAYRLRHLEELTCPEWIDQQFLDIGAARSGEPLAGINGIVIHYVGNPGTTAMNNRNYFAKEDTEVCSHFVVGLEGEIVQCVPLRERSAASNNRNRDTISIEVCHPDESGRFNEATYAAVVRLTAWLCGECGLDEQAVIRHYDVTGKLCPLYYVEHEDAWEQMKKDIAAAM